MTDCSVCYDKLGDQSNPTINTKCCNQDICENCFKEWHKTSNLCIFCRYEDRGTQAQDVHFVGPPPRQPQGVARVGGVSDVLYEIRYDLFCYFLILIIIMLIIFRHKF